MQLFFCEDLPYIQFHPSSTIIESLYVLVMLLAIICIMCQEHCTSCNYSFAWLCADTQVQELFHYEAEMTKGLVMGVGMVSYLQECWQMAIRI